MLKSPGHFGLRSLFGDELNKILKQAAALRRSDVEAKARQYGLDMNVEKDRLIAAEEVLAELAQTNPKSRFVQWAIAAIRKWLRENIEHYKELKLTDGEIISNYIVPAREFVQKGRTADQGEPSLRNPSAFSRKDETDTPAFGEDIPNEEWLQETGGLCQGEGCPAAPISPTTVPTPCLSFAILFEMIWCIFESDRKLWRKTKTG